jgi:hypothetical protein
MSQELENKLRSMNISDLKKEISKTNVRGYSKLKKEELIKFMLTNKNRFMYLLNQEKQFIKKAGKTIVVKKKENLQSSEKPKNLQSSEPKPQRKLTEIEKISQRIEDIRNKIGFFMNPNQKNEKQKLIDEREQLRKKLNELLKKKVEELDKSTKVAPEPEPKKPQPEPKKEKSRKYRYSFDIQPKDIQDDLMDLEDLIKKNEKIFENIYIRRNGFRRGDPDIPDISYLLYLDKRLNLSGLDKEQERQSLDYYISQVKSVIKQVKNLSIDDRDIFKWNKEYKPIKAQELRLLVPIKPEPKKEEPKNLQSSEPSKLDKLKIDLEKLQKELNKLPQPRQAKTVDVAEKIIDMRKKLSSKIANIKFDIFEEEGKQKDRDEKDRIKKEKKELSDFKKAVNEFIKKPTEELLEEIDNKFELTDEIPESLLKKLERAIDKYNQRLNK